MTHTGKTSLLRAAASAFDLRSLLPPPPSMHRWNALAGRNGNWCNRSKTSMGPAQTNEGRHTAMRMRQSPRTTCLARDCRARRAYWHSLERRVQHAYRLRDGRGECADAWWLCALSAPRSHYLRGCIASLRVNSIRTRCAAKRGEATRPHVRVPVGASEGL